MDSDVMVTIGIPVYNAGRYLKNAIDSVLSQTCRDFEVLITIDGSTDDSADIAGRYADPRIRTIVSDENKGVSYRINQQVCMARGHFFARMDADDIMFPDRIEKQVEFMQKNPDIDAIGSQAVVIDVDNKIIGFRESDTVFSSSSIREKILFIHPTVFGRTDWFRKNPYSEDLAGVEDFYLWNTTFRRSRFHVLDIPLMFYRDPPVTLNSTYPARQKQMRRALVRLHRNSVMSAFTFCKLYLLSMLKSVIYKFLWKVNLSDKLVSGRNIPVPSDKLPFYSDMLENMIRTDHP
jgi:glycosyltransferase involved in cell wall biosynthesis